MDAAVRRAITHPITINTEEDTLRKEPAMLTCTICHFDTELDDVVVGRAPGRCICLRCYGRATGSARSMPKALQRAVSGALADFPVA